MSGSFEDGIGLTYQPIVSLIPERPTVLALHPRCSGRLAGESIPAIHGRELIETLLQKAAEERAEAALYLEVSADDLVRKDIEALFDSSRAAQKTRKRLIVEIGAGCSVSKEALADMLDELRWAGIRVSVATECSNASYRLLLETHPDYLRISDYVVRDCARDVNRQAVLEAITHLAWKLGSAVIADGVTSREDLGTLKSLGVDYAEGGHLCAPLPFNEAIRWAEDVHAESTEERPARAKEVP
ncbi:MAG: EAL domain-containing protein [Vicinamibacteria bacterium]|nr:EAL domain-containing protein [Vicinamibacteria bacterium]